MHGTKKIFFSVSGGSDFARKFQGQKLPFSINIIPVNSNSHWSVNTTKVNSDVDRVTFVSWKDKFIQLDSNDVIAVYKCTGMLQIDCRYQTSVSHEIGHLILADDEYIQPPDDFDSSYLNLEDSNGLSFNDPLSTAGSIYSRDVDGLMNVGMELRERYVKYLDATLSVMIPETFFLLRVWINDTFYFCTYYFYN